MRLPSELAPFQSAKALTASEETAIAAAQTLAKVFVNFIGFVLHKNIFLAFKLFLIILYRSLICKWQFAQKNFFVLVKQYKQ